MRRMMYKLISIILAVLLFMTMFTGCAGKETGPLKICVDLGAFSEISDYGMGLISEERGQQYAMQQFEADLTAYLEANSLDPIELEFEFIPGPEDAERDTAIARLRTEIMSGKGPDIFLLGSNSRDMEPLFKVPEKNMANGAFLPLNEYIENAQFMEFEKLVPGVMSAGQYDGEQYILPLTYTMPLTLYNASEVQHTTSETMTWEQMLEGEDYLRHAAYFYSATGFVDLFMLNSFGQIADYENDTLTLTEEELLKRTEEMIALENIRFHDEDAQNALPTNWQIYLCYGFDQLAKWGGYRPSSQNLFAGETDETVPTLDDPMTIVPMYSDDCGAMATVLTYAAINANTTQPEKAFFVLDYLFGLESQQSSSVFHLTCVDAVPVHMDLMQEEYPLKYRAYSRDLGHYYLNDGTYENWREVQEQITGAVFSGELYYTLESMYTKCSYAARKGESYDTIVAETYNTLKQIMAE